MQDFLKKQKELQAKISSAERELEYEKKSIAEFNKNDTYFYYTFVAGLVSIIISIFFPHEDNIFLRFFAGITLLIGPWFLYSRFFGGMKKEHEEKNSRYFKIEDHINKDILLYKEELRELEEKLVKEYSKTQ